MDLDPKTNPTILSDLLEWKYTDYPSGFFKIIAASVPCAEYSIAKTTAPREFSKADALVCRVLDIVEYFSPKIWWIENPRTGHLKNRPMMKNIPFVDIDYCQFSDWGYQKPTRFWGSPNLGNLAHVRCPGKACLNVIKQGQRLRHKENLGGNGMRFNTILKGRIPPKVVDYLIQDGEYALINQRKSGIYARKRGYKVDPKIRAEIFQKMGVDRALICVDLFADQENALDQMYMTEQNSAWSYDWSKFCDDGKILWANPPIEDLKRVVTKACLDPCKLLLVSPNWKFGNWKEILGKVAVKEYVTPPISQFFRKIKMEDCCPRDVWELNFQWLIPLIDGFPRNIWTHYW